MSAMAFDAATTSAGELAQRHPNMVPIVCTAAGAASAKTAAYTVLVPRTATVADLQALLREAFSTTKAVHVFVGDATPASETAIADLLLSYSSATDGMLHVAYTLEGRYGVGVGLGLCSLTVGVT